MAGVAVDEPAMAEAEHEMTPAQMAALLDAALRCGHPLTYLDTTIATYRMLGRANDATTTALMGRLYAEGEIELLMSLRAAWKRGEVRSPADMVGWARKAPPNDGQHCAFHTRSFPRL